MIGQARTGSGKTLAFAVPLTEQCDPSVRRVQALVLTPTRELAIQVAGVTDALASRQGLRLTMLYGGHSLKPDYTALRNGAQIIIGTPGRTLDHIRQGTLDLRSVRFLVLDEADEMLDRGFAHDVEAILSQTPSKRQTALFSATMPSWVDQDSEEVSSQPCNRGNRRRRASAALGGAPGLYHPTEREAGCAPDFAEPAHRRPSPRFRQELSTASRSWHSASTTWAMR